jgi:hypothetical protein
VTWICLACPQGEPTMTVKLMTGENLKSPPLPLLPHQIWYICKPCWLLLLSRARSCAFCRALAANQERSSCERCLTNFRGTSSSSELGALRQRWAQGPCWICFSLMIPLCFEELLALRLSWSMLKLAKHFFVCYSCFFVVLSWSRSFFFVSILYM